jgi:adenylate cyclase
MSDTPTPIADTHKEDTLTDDQALIRLPWRRRFDFKVSALVGITALIIVIGVGVFTYRSIVRAKLDSFKERMQSLAVSISQTVDADELARLPADPEQVRQSPTLVSLKQRFVHILEEQPDIDSIYVLQSADKPGWLKFLIDASKDSRTAPAGELYDATTMSFMLQGFQRPTVEDQSYRDEFGETQSAYAPLKTSDGRVIGIIGVDVLALRLDQTRWQVIWFCVAVFGIAGIAVAILAGMVRRQVQRPLSRVLHAAAAIASGRLDTCLKRRSTDEFGLLTDQFDVMARQLRERERLRETFGLYVSRDVAAALMKEGKLPELGGVECVATVLFCDLSNYTRISETFSPRETIDIINEYLAAMSDVIEKHEGCVLDFTGDGIIAAFGLILPDADHAQHAVECAIGMRQRLNQLNGEWEARGLAVRWQAAGVDSIEARIGIHTGPLIAGNIGSASRMKYCAMGDTVNIAARLEELNKDFNSTILLSDQVRVRLPVAMAAGLSDYGVVNVRGRVQAIGAYSL